MSRWLEKKEFGSIVVEKGIVNFRIKKDKQTFYLARNRYDIENKKSISRDFAFDTMTVEDAENFFNNEIETMMSKRVLGRKERRYNQRLWAKLRKKMVKSNVVIDDSSKSTEELKEEATESMKEAISQDQVNE